MTYRLFKTIQELTGEVVNLLRQHMQIRSNAPHAVMLPGGQTPLPVYDSIRQNPFPVSHKLHIMMSDERMVPENSPDSNFAQAAGMISSLDIPATRIIKVQTSLSCEAAAEQYDSDISAFFAKNGRLTLAILGLGSDGHTASLFSSEDVARAPDKFAVAVTRSVKPDRVSTTRSTITRAEKIVFLAVGEKKEKIIAKFKHEPGSVIAGQAVRDVASTELWFTP